MPCELIDVTWRLAARASSSACDVDVDVARVTVRLHLRERGRGARVERAWFETVDMSLTQFYELARECERAREALISASEE